MSTVLVFQHAPHETLGALELHFGDARVPWQEVPLYREIPLRLDLEAAAGLVVLGGPMNVDEVDRYPFLVPEVQWIRDALRFEVPVLGICLGAQLLAKALGARVYPNGVKEIGWYHVDLTPDAGADPLFTGLEARQTVFQWHGDTFDLPDRAILLATSPLCRHQAFRCGPSAWGLQFHVEMTEELIHQWLEHPQNGEELASLDDIDPEAIRSEIEPGLGAMRIMGDRVLPAFARRCAERAGSRPKSTPEP
ncbi:MAG: type 1 glutamine amidotransferase [Pirellulales bacterium]|nr:type 1 glutamine amidotransferase [Pirellulales bacterium]